MVGDCCDIYGGVEKWDCVMGRNIENTERNERIFESVIRGSTFTSVAEAEGISRERVRQIVHKMRRKMLSPKRLGNDAIPDADDLQVNELRRCYEFWLAQLKKLKAEHGDLS